MIDRLYIWLCRETQKDTNFIRVYVYTYINRNIFVHVRATIFDEELSFKGPIQIQKLIYYVSSYIFD